MISTIYVEKEISQHPRVQSILQRFNKNEVIECDHYSELFNRKAQNFRMQKQNPSLILAKKHKGFVLPAPDAYSIGGDKNFYFSHMMNCIYDCRYCFLQGMYRSAHYVLFVNYEDFSEDIVRVANENKASKNYFFSGYDCDSLALEPVTGFVDFILSVFEKHPNIWLELRTKSTQIRDLLNRDALKNCVVAFSLSPENIVSALEAKTPSLIKRIDAIKKLQNKGWPIGLRFDPLIYHDDFEKSYAQMFAEVFQHIDLSLLHSVSLGNFRMPQKFFQNMTKLYPYEKMFASDMCESEGMVSYSTEKEQLLLQFCESELLRYIPQEKFFPCQ